MNVDLVMNEKSYSAEEHFSKRWLGEDLQNLRDVVLSGAKSEEANVVSPDLGAALYMSCIEQSRATLEGSDLTLDGYEFRIDPIKV